MALLALLAVIAIGASWFLVSKLNAESAVLSAVKSDRNAEVLNRAKQALIGYVAHQAAVSGEDNPGAFPCPEAPGGFTSTSGTDGKTQSPSCTLPAVGRFPWRTIGTDKLVDAAGEPLWYVVASGWSKPSSTGNTVINSNCTDSGSAMTCWTGQLTVDGQANAAVALIIAPGPAFNAAAAASSGCNAVAQVRDPTVAPVLTNYLECQNATNPADATFVTTGPSGSFNDQVIKITAAEVLPVIEAAIADRFQKEFGAKMRTAYSGGLWASTPVLPYPVAFSTPTSSPANKLQGAAGLTEGLLPGNYAFEKQTCDCDTSTTPQPCLCKVNTLGQRAQEPCTTGSDTRCDPSFVSWRTTSPCGGAAFCTTASSDAGSPVTLEAATCTVSGTPTTLSCTIDGSTSLFNALFGNTSMTFGLNAVASNVGMTLRQISSPTSTSQAPAITGIDTTYATAPAIAPFGYGISAATLNTDGSATVTIKGRFSAGSGSILAVLGSLTCSIFGVPVCYRYTMTVPMGIVADHALVAADSSYSWFYRNKWHEVSYYAVASGIVPSGARSCTSSSTCLTVAYNSNAGKQRGVLILAGQKLGGQARPATALSDLFEGANTDGTSPFEQRSAGLATNRAFNDHFAVIDSNP